ncbi:YybH family protein [Ferruginibacter sp. SUN002]|uniref:YybH family protein n=1 Tax=Ferruginibacter sp. SUN002 TaxID=2937789 RepID=UPI003D36F8D1
MKKFLPFIAFLFILSSCFNKKPDTDIVQEKMNMVQADRDFSKMSEEKGWKAAYFEYIDSNGILLRPNTKPIFGGEAIFYITQGEDSTYSVTWDPQGSTIAQSGEIGYTYGIYSLKSKNDSTVEYGTYVNVWKKQPDNKWKFVLNCGNEGVGELK